MGIIIIYLFGKDKAFYILTFISLMFYQFSQYKGYNCNI